LALRPLSRPLARAADNPASMATAPHASTMRWQASPANFSKWSRWPSICWI